MTQVDTTTCLPSTAHALSAHAHSCCTWKSKGHRYASAGQKPNKSPVAPRKLNSSHGSSAPKVRPRHRMARGQRGRTSHTARLPPANIAVMLRSIRPSWARPESQGGHKDEEQCYQHTLRPQNSMLPGTPHAAPSQEPLPAAGSSVHQAVCPLSAAKSLLHRVSLQPDCTFLPCEKQRYRNELMAPHNHQIVP